MEKEIRVNDFDKYFSIDLTPMYCKKIQELNIKLKKLSEIDALTGVYNCRFFDEYYEIEITRVLNQIEHKQEEKYKMNFCIAILDIDNFKKVNDTYLV